jgi:hypothetical protein
LTGQLNFLNYDHYISPEYFGGTAFKEGTMAKKVLKNIDAEETKLLPQVALLLSDLAKLPLSGTFIRREERKA